MSDRDRYEFPNCMHAFSGAMHMLRVDPTKLVICLPKADWWTLYCKLDQKFQGLMRFDGRDGLTKMPTEFKYMGITFKAQSEV